MKLPVQSTRLLLATLIITTASTDAMDSGQVNEDATGHPQTSTDYVNHILTLIKTVPSLKKMVEASGLNFEDLEILVGERHLLSDLVHNVYKLSPIAGQVIDEGAKNNPELRVLLAIANGKSPNLFDVLQMASGKQENMFLTVDNAASKNAYAQLILKKMKEPNPNLSEIYTMLTGREVTEKNILDNEKYSVGTPAVAKERHLEELFQFIGRNWRDLERALRTMVNFPTNWIKVINYFLGLDYSAFRFALDTSTVLNGKKYVVINNKSKYAVVDHTGHVIPEADADITNVLNEIRVKYPAMQEEFEGPGGNALARDAVVHLVEEGIEVFNRLLS